jgi:hypothetical protein
MPHPLQLGIGLHLAGALCAALAALHLMGRGVCNLRRRRHDGVADAPASTVDAPAPAAPAPRPRRRPMPPPRRLTEARSHFGLRGLP